MILSQNPLFVKHHECHVMSFHTHFKNTLNEKGDEMKSEGNEMIDGSRNVYEDSNIHAHRQSIN